MDDPWGSPWADELHQSIPAPGAKGTNGLTLTPILPGKDAAPIEKANIEWDAPGDGFGSWASPPLVQEITKDPSTSTALPTWETTAAGDIKKIDAGGLSPNWDASQPASGLSTPKLSPTLLSKPSDVPRQPSPDPWSTVETILDADHKDMSERPGGQDEENRAQTVVDANSAETPEFETEGQSPAKSKEDELPPPTESNRPTEIGPNPELKDTKNAIAIPEQDKDGKDTDVVSRSSSSPSDHSNHNEVHAESPRTSLDDDTQRPEVHRHVSEKIQVLVEHYDSLAKAQPEDDVIVTRAPRSDRGDAAEEEPEVEGTHVEESKPRNSLGISEESSLKVTESNNEIEIKEEGPDEVESEATDEHQVENEKQVKEQVEAEDEDDDFGDFEEGTSQISEPVGDEEQSSHPQADQVLDGDKSQAPDDSASAARARPVPEKDFGRVEYLVDIAALSNLYQDLQPEPLAIDPADKLVIPDTVPHDSFTSVEERKMWYRLSRYTTLRQHNSGDDDNTYIRVSWAESNVREETLKFAGKWMEQDRISGRVVLGGGSKDGSLFGWNDPKAAPMPLATAFAMNRERKKTQAATASAASSKAPKEPSKGGSESRPPSQSNSPQKQRRRSSTKAPRTSVDAKQKIQQPVASFGWSSEPQEAAPLPIRNSKPVSSNSPPHAQQPVAPFDWNQGPQSTAAPPVLNQQPMTINPPSSQKPSPPAPQLQPVSDIFASANSPSQIPSSFSGWDESPPRAKVPVPVIASVPTKALPPSALSITTVSTSPAKPSAPIIQSTANDFDDDWGEMISSPAVIAPPQLPQAPALRHKKSQSLVGTSLSPSQAPINVPSLESISASSGHKQTSSLDGSSISNPFSMNAKASTLFSASPNNAAPHTSSAFDPWASADFSFFDTPGPPPKPKSAPPPKQNVTQIHRQGAQSVSFESTRVPPPQRGNGKTREELEQDRVVARIIRGLPDLSYMMRR